MALWGARFSSEADQRLQDFNSSIAIDSKMFEQDIKGSIAHVTMLAAQGIVDEESKDSIIENLTKIKEEIESGQLVIDPKAEDIHMFIEGELTKRTPAGKNFIPRVLVMIKLLWILKCMPCNDVMIW